MIRQFRGSPPRRSAAQAATKSFLLVLVLVLVLAWLSRFFEDEDENEDEEEKSCSSCAILEYCAAMKAMNGPMDKWTGVKSLLGRRTSNDPVLSFAPWRLRSAISQLRRVLRRFFTTDEHG